MTTPLVYEVTLDIEAGAAPEFDAWLKDHVKAMLALPGFHDARILKPEGAEPGSERRVVQYTLGSRQELDQYLSEHAPRMRADGTERFGDKLKSSRRVLDVETTGGALALPGLALPPAGPRCRNCGTPLSGKFCMECGQKNHTYVAPLWHVLHEFASLHFGFDTKLFHSLVPLLFRPGFLTREYCLGHEERYIKPFKLYLFSSILFFFLAAIFWPQLTDFDSGNNVTTRGGPPGTHQMTPEKKDQTRADIQKAMQQVEASTAAAPAKAFAQSLLQQELAALDKAPAAATRAAPGAATLAAAGGSHLHVAVPSAASGPVAQALAEAEQDRQKDRAQDKDGDDGDLIHFDSPERKKKVEESDNRFVKAMMNINDHRDEFKKQLKQNLPKMMFILMPLIALFLKLFYIRSKRYLTEHFVFTLHFHSMVFVVMLFVMLLSGAGHHVAWLAPIGAKAGNVAGWYVALYAFLALRFFYQQGWFMTGLKFFMLFISYTIAIGITFALGVVLTAVEI
jgi:hypothetical protein